MGSPPLAALALRPPAQPESPIQSIGQLLMLKNQMQQGQALEQENQLRALQIKDQQTLRASANGLDWNKPDTFDKWLQNAQEKGVSPQTLSQIALQRAQYKDQLAKTDKSTLDAEQERNNQLLGHIDAIKNEKDPAKRAQVAVSQAAQILNGGLAKDPGTVQMLQSVAQGQKVPTDDELQYFEIGLTDHKTQVDQAIKQQEANSKDWKEFGSLGVLVNTRSGEVKTPAGQAMSPGMLESKYVAIQQKQNLKQPLAPEEAAFLKAYKQMKEIVPQFNINMGLSGGGAGPSSGAGGGQSTVENVPSNLQGSVKAVLEYRSPMPPQSRANPVNTAIRQWVNKIDPTYDETTFPQRNKILTEYVKDANTGQIGAINTALGHLGELNAAAKALDQNNLPLLHSIASKLGAAFGDDAATTYTSILHRVGPELTSAYLKGGGTVDERGSNEGDFSISKGQKQIVSNIGEAAKLLRSKMASKEQDWNVTFKPAKDADKFENRFITPEAKQTLDALSSQSPVGKSSGSLTVTAPNGKTYSFKDQDALNKFKKAAGIQ